MLLIKKISTDQKFPKIIDHKKKKNAFSILRRIEIKKNN